MWFLGQPALLSNVMNVFRALISDWSKISRTLSSSSTTDTPIQRAKEVTIHRKLDVLKGVVSLLKGIVKLLVKTKKAKSLALF